MSTATITRQAVLAVAAGPELDSLVAERVLGWVHVKDAVNNRWQIGGVDFPDVAPWDRRCLTPDDQCLEHVLAWEHGFPCFLPKFSDDIAAAWEVVEAMRAAGYCFCLEAEAIGVEPSEPFARFMRDGHHINEHYPRDDREWNAFGATASLAICRAALFAVLDLR